jgi:hypothetical protein
MDWEAKATEKCAGLTDPLEKLVFPMRMFVRIPQTHPSQAKILLSHLSFMASIIPLLQAQLIEHLKELTKAKILTPTDSAAAKNIQGILLFSVVNQLTTPKSTVADADMAIRTALSMLGLSDAKAKKLIEAKLPL